MVYLFFIGFVIFCLLALCDFLHSLRKFYREKGELALDVGPFMKALEVSAGYGQHHAQIGCCDVPTCLILSVRTRRFT